MIVDTSALVAIVSREPHADTLLDAILDGDAAIPAPAFVEFNRVVSGRGSRFAKSAVETVEQLFANGLKIEPFTSQDAVHASNAISAHGSGNGRGGKLNLLDLMVYAVARRTGQPILCTGKDFAATDADIHPSSRRW